MRTPMIIAIAMVLAGCDSAREPAIQSTEVAPPTPVSSEQPSKPVVRPASPSPALAIDGEGLRLVDPDSGRTRPIPFGTARATTLEVLAGRGQPQVGTNSECGAGPLGWVRYRDGLMLQFQGDRFVGWSLGEDATGKITTLAGIGPGSTRADLEKAYAITLPESTLGIEFTAGALGGILDGPGKSAKITDLWAGVTCMFR